MIRNALSLLSFGGMRHFVNRLVDEIYYFEPRIATFSGTRDSPSLKKASKRRFTSSGDSSGESWPAREIRTNSLRGSSRANLVPTAGGMNRSASPQRISVGVWIWGDADRFIPPAVGTRFARE